MDAFDRVKQINRQKLSLGRFHFILYETEDIMARNFSRKFKFKCGSLILKFVCLQ